MFEIIQWVIILGMLGNKMFNAVIPNNLEKNVKKLLEIHKGHPDL